MSEQTLKRGDLSPCGTKRFWAYQSFIKKDGNRAERWVPCNQYEETRKRQSWIGKVAEYRRSQREQLLARRAA